MTKFLPKALSASLAALCFNAGFADDHLQIPNFDIATSTLTLPVITRDLDPNQQYSDVSLTLLGLDNLLAVEPDMNGVPAYQTIRVNLSPGQQTAEDVVSTGSCRGLARIVHASRYLEASVVCDHIDVVAAHIHNAEAGTNGGIVYHLEVDSEVNPEGTMDGTLTQLSRHDCTARTNAGNAQQLGSCLNEGLQDRTQLSESEYADFLAGNFYFNVHTAANPGGELRGQITPASRTLTSAVQCSQSESEIARGAIVAETNAEGDDFATCNATLIIDLDTLQINAILIPDFSPEITGVHIHMRADAESASGGVIVPLADDGNGNYISDPGTVFTMEQLAAFLDSRLYFNVHTADNAPGSSRARIWPTLR